MVDLAFETWGKRPPESWSSVHRLHGGDIDRFETYLSDEVADQPCGLEEDQVTRLVRNYGAAYGDVLRHLDREDRAPAHPDHLAVLRAECLHGIRDEMALKLSDVVLRRTELGTAGRPEDGIVTLCAEVMAKELGWSRDRMQEEIQQVEEAYAWGSKQ